MARTSGKRQVSLPVQKLADSTMVPSIVPEFIVMLSSGFQSEPPSPDVSGDTNTLDCIACFINSSQEDIIGLTVEFRALRRSAEDGSAVVSGSFLASARVPSLNSGSSDELRKSLAELFINLSVWQNFRSIYSAVSSQSVVDLKPLPDGAVSIRWLASDEFDDEAFNVPMARREEDDKNGTATVRVAQDGRRKRSGKKKA